MASAALQSSHQDVPNRSRHVSEVAGQPNSRSATNALSSTLCLTKSPPPAFHVSVHQSASSARLLSSRTTMNVQGWVFSALGACTAHLAVRIEAPTCALGVDAGEQLAH